MQSILDILIFILLLFCPSVVYYYQHIAMKLLGAKKNRSLSSTGKSIPARRRPALSSSVPSTTRSTLGHGSASQKTTPKLGADYRSMSGLPTSNASSGGGGNGVDAPLPVVASTPSQGNDGASHVDTMDDDDSWMYSFGVESEAKAEERHKARIENEACKKRIEEVMGELQKQESLADGLREGQEKNRDEMRKNLLSLQEMKGNAQVDKEQLRTLEQSLRYGLMQPLVSGMANDESVTEKDDETEKDDSATDSGSTKKKTAKKFLQVKQSKVNELSSAADKSFLTKIKNDEKKLRDEITELQRTIKTENLEDKLKQKEAERDERRKVLDSKLLRKQQIEETIREKSAKSEQNTLALAAKREILDNNKTKAAARHKTRQG